MSRSPTQLEQAREVAAAVGTITPPADSTGSATTAAGRADGRLVEEIKASLQGKEQVASVDDLP